MFHTVLVPVDLTDKNLVAIKRARELAALAKGRVLVLHVIETLEGDFEELEPFYQQLEQSARERLNALAAAAGGPEVEFQQTIVYGKRVPAILRYASENNVDLIVISSHQVDPNDPRRTWMTISHQVALLAPCPVLILR